MVSVLDPCLVVHSLLISVEECYIPLFCVLMKDCNKPHYGMTNSLSQQKFVSDCMFIGNCFVVWSNPEMHTEFSGKT